MLVKSLVNPGFVGALDSQPGVLLPLAYRYDTALSDPDKTNFKNLLNDYFGMY
jgi:hypothetical protein